MKLTPREQKTVRSYDANAREWIEKHSEPRYWGEEMNAFAALLPQGKVLEIGTGGGKDAKELLAKGYEYVGVDVSAGLLKEARKNVPGATFLQQSVYDLDFPESSFDGFWACAVLLHIPKDRIDEALQNIRRVVRRGGIGFISLKRGKGERIEKDEAHTGGTGPRFFAYYSQAEFERILERNGFEVVNSAIRPVDKRTTWLIFLVKVAK